MFHSIFLGKRDPLRRVSCYTYNPTPWCKLRFSTAHCPSRGFCVIKPVDNRLGSECRVCGIILESQLAKESACDKLLSTLET